MRYGLSNVIIVFKKNSLLHTELLICYDGENGPIWAPINFKIRIYSTGFYSPPGMKNEANTSIQLSMWSFAAESRRFGHNRRNNAKILRNFGLILILSVAETMRAGPAKIKIKTKIYLR